MMQTELFWAALDRLGLSQNVVARTAGHLPSMPERHRAAEERRKCEDRSAAG